MMNFFTHISIKHSTPYSQLKYIMTEETVIFYVQLPRSECNMHAYAKLVLAGSLLQVCLQCQKLRIL